jgi:hypothetical protein
MVRLICARTITRTTMQLSSLVRTGTTSKWFATNPTPNPSIEGGGITKRPLGIDCGRGAGHGACRRPIDHADEFASDAVRLQVVV